ncbi:tRNA (N6-isopentenyl adenosine(37)-C2)-methylthiotransferase MiaB [Dissulfurirhabdus thermomarina]|uniref:tRNA-2-methylthio-N(6)-dimethylallyladenosine synthase n=1 Tax=Dissulfurirhabdus thermomarina TaxID=1765737 RepID=A0A6N9TRQ8_DISTH|nr:tRNA (N6-isopentenyl adenosine(37)-C2)-methylthiotransferase MiaB [Dissulfurirhabdus thermomarina]NDY42127.1 tRNA (N6-isopentenyl adenosine(37)-C2)-methylthiotransferase MiaB [Dissulfurirhabdus thermomarina]NMX23138.1 tRNA (N6-isopentenyl adenosine(37)-C2)-methylthiotransferase MiaB [Dissulfurirhabdus thermomarina]
MPTKRVYLATFGCQMNEYDSLKMLQVLGGGWRRTDRPREADLILVNTCSIREKAEHKVYSLVGRFRSLKRRNPRLVIGVAGCVAQQEGERLLRRLPHLDIVFGPQHITELPDLVRRVAAGEGPVCRTSLRADYAIPLVRGPLPGPPAVRAFVTIMQGCDNFCAYCVVPHVRGREVSRPADDVEAEVRDLVARGVREVTLLGQNVNSYGRKGGTATFAELLRRIGAVDGLHRLRFTTSHPRDLTDDIIACFREVPVLCEHLHLPVQSGSDRILRRMNRHYTRAHYLGLVDRLRAAVPDMPLTTDLIVGFPGETVADFEATLDLLTRVRFEQVFAFKYSPRPFTPAADLPDKVPEAEKARRLAEVLALQDEIGRERLRRFEGTLQEVLVEGPSKGDAGELTGRTRGNHVVNFDSAGVRVGEMVPVRIEQALAHSLRGRVRHAA